MRPSQAGFKGMHVSIGQRLQTIIAHGWVGDHASGRVEMIEVQAQKQTVARTRLVIQPRRKHQIVALSRSAAEIGIQGSDDIRHLLQVHRIVRIWRDVGAGHGQRSVWRREGRPIRNAKVRGQETGLRAHQRLVDYRNRIAPQLLLVIEKEPQTVSQDRPTHAGSELLQTILRFRKTCRFVESVIRTGRGISVVIEGAAVETYCSPNESLR